MAGTKEGGKKAATKNLAKNPNFYADIGRIGGRNGNTGGFAAYRQCECPVLPFAHHKAQCAGKRGGRNSRRRKAHLSATVAQ